MVALHNVDGVLAYEQLSNDSSINESADKSTNYDESSLVSQENEMARSHEEK